MIAKLELLVDELTLLVKETRAYVARCAPIDWTLLYGPRGTEIRRPGDEPPPGITIGP